MNSETTLSAAPVDAIVSQPLPLDSIVCGDNVATLATFPDASIDLVVTSPPYDNLRTYGGHSWDSGNADPTYFDWLISERDEFKEDLKRYLASERGKARMEGRAM